MTPENVAADMGVCITHSQQDWRAAGLTIAAVDAKLPFQTLAGPAYDALAVLTGQPDDAQRQAVWHLLLNRGYRIPGVAVTPAECPSGAPQPWLYTQVEGALTRESLARGVRAGRNCVSTGPLLQFSLGAQGVGEVIPAKGMRLPVRIHAWLPDAEQDALTRVQLIRNGVVVREWRLEAGARCAEVGATVDESWPSWFIARAYGKDESRVAFTNPIYFSLRGGEPPEPVPAEVTASVFDAHRGTPLPAQLAVLLDGETKERLTLPDGTITRAFPAAARLQASAPGYIPCSRDIFGDSPLAEAATRIAGEGFPALLAPETYTAVQALLQDVRLEFPLEPVASA